MIYRSQLASIEARFVAPRTPDLRICNVLASSSAGLSLRPKAYTIITQEVYEQFPNGLTHEPFQTFDNYVQFNPQQTFPGPPTPPGPHQAAQSAPAASAAAAPHPAHAAADIIPSTKAENEEQARRQGSNSEEDDLTPAQSRRKAQNRAAYVLSLLLQYHALWLASSGPLKQPPTVQLLLIPASDNEHSVSARNAMSRISKVGSNSCRKHSSKRSRRTRNSNVICRR